MRQSKGTEGFWPCCTAGWWTTRRSSSAHMLEGILDNSLGRKWITKREWGKSHWQSPYCPYWLICQLVHICGWTITSCLNFMGNLPCVRIFLRRRWLSLQPVSSLDGEGQSRTRWPQETWPFKLWQDWSQTFERTKAREQWSSQKIGTGRWLDRISALPTLYSQGQYHACALLTFVFRARMVLMKRSMPHGIISRPTIPRRRKRSRGKDLDRNFAGCRWIVATTDCRLRDWILAFANPVSCTSVVTVVTVAIFLILLRHHLEAWKIFEETINKSSSVDWHPSPKPKPGSGRGGLGKMIQRKSKKSVWLLLFTFFHNLSHVYWCFSLFPNVPNVRFLARIFRFPTQPQIEQCCLCRRHSHYNPGCPGLAPRIPSHCNLVVPANFWTWETWAACAFAPYLWYPLVYIYILWSSRSVDPCWTWLCGLQVLHPAAAGGGTGDWGTTEVFSASTVSVLWTGTPAATTKRQQANLVARISQCYDSCQKADFLPFHWPTVDLSLMNALSKPLSRSWCCDVLCDFPLDLQQLNQPLHGVRSVQMSGWDMNPFAHYSLLIIVTYYAVWSYCLFCCWFCQSCRRDLRAVWTTRCWSLETRLPSFRRLLCLKRPIEEVACLSFEAVDLWRFKAHLWSTASVKKNGYAVLIQLHARC